jgi:hypothetical protein
MWTPSLIYGQQIAVGRPIKYRIRNIHGSCEARRKSLYSHSTELDGRPREPSRLGSCRCPQDIHRRPAATSAEGSEGVDAAMLRCQPVNKMICVEGSSLGRLPRVMHAPGTRRSSLATLDGLSRVRPECAAIRRSGAASAPGTATTSHVSGCLRRAWPSSGSGTLAG